MSLRHFQALNANSDSNSEGSAICDKQCQPDPDPAFTEQRIFSDTTAQQPKSKVEPPDIDIYQELSAPPLLGDAGHSESLPSPPQISLSHTSELPSPHSEGYEGSHSEPCCLVEQPIVLLPPSCATERKLGPFDQSRAPGSSPELVGEVPDPPNLGYFLGITTPQIPTLYFPSDWILSVHRDWGWLSNIGGEKAPTPDKRNTSKSIGRVLAEWASSSPGAFHNANGFGFHGSSIVPPSHSKMACASERKLGPFDQSRAPGSGLSPEPVGEVPDPPNFGHFLGMTTPRIPTRHFFSDWILSVHHDWGWLPNIRGEKAPAPDKRNILRFIRRFLAECASESPGAFNNANGFGIHGSSFATAQNVHYTTNHYWPGSTGNPEQSLRDLHLQQQIEQLQKQLEVSAPEFANCGLTDLV
jgi:hypothetical protein